MKTIILLLGFAFCQNCFADTHIFRSTNINTIAVSDWSEAVESNHYGIRGYLRARLLIFEGYSPAYEGKVPETLVYLELNSIGRTQEIYCDFQEGLRYELRDINNQPAPIVGQGGSGAYPDRPGWITLPPDSTIRLRASWHGYGMSKDEGLKIPFFRPLIIKAENTNQYFLSVTFTVAPPTNHIVSSNHCIWQGTLTIPKMKISARRP